MEITWLKRINEIKSYLINMQDRICEELGHIDGAPFSQDSWSRSEGGGGIARLIEGGRVIERGGVNFSHVYGKNLPPSATATRPELAGCDFQALGVSLVIHPRNPYAPTSHANIRFFIAQKSDGKVVWWFGGGFDMTPYYGFEEDAIHWHKMAKEACAPFGEHVYQTFKKSCDDYFFLKHRNEARGVGGLFFDDLNEWGFERSFEFIKRVAEYYLLAYVPILTRRKEMIYSDRERQFQLYRRGRYVEFNLLYDRGTLFGLQSQGRTESILMSLPPLARWQYDWHPEKNTPEAELYEKFLAAREWINSV